MAKDPVQKLLKRLQRYIDEIAETPKDNLPRFLLLKKKATRLIARIKYEHPEIKSFPVRAPAGLMDTPDTPTKE